MKKSPVQVAFLMGVTLMSSQTIHAYKLQCPTPGSIEVKGENNAFKYSGPMTMEGNTSDKTIIMKAAGKEKFDPSTFVLQAASLSSDNQLSCLYGDSKGSDTVNSLTLLAPLSKGSTCTVMYPKGHENPELVYFECSDSLMKE